MKNNKSIELLTSKHARFSPKYFFLLFSGIILYTAEVIAQFGTYALLVEPFSIIGSIMFLSYVYFFVGIWVFWDDKIVSSLNVKKHTEYMIRFGVIASSFVLGYIVNIYTPNPLQIPDELINQVFFGSLVLVIIMIYINSHFNIVNHLQLSRERNYYK